MAIIKLKQLALSLSLDLMCEMSMLHRLKKKIESWWLRGSISSDYGMLQLWCPEQKYMTTKHLLLQIIDLFWIEI